jgi:hypothetical protein
MLWSGSSSRTAVRDSIWGLLLFAGVAWLAIAWSVLRLAPSDIVTVGSAVLFFGALCEAVRALVGMKTWWLNAGMAVLFAATGAVLLVDRDSTYSTPLSLIAWFLMVRGALDVAVSVMNRGVDRTWGLIMTLGLAQAGLGFFAASPLARSTDPVIVTLGGLCMLRAVADLTTSLRLREVAHAHHDVLALPPERQAGVAGYAAGLADYPAHADIHKSDATTSEHGVGPVDKPVPLDMAARTADVSPAGNGGPTGKVGPAGNLGVAGNVGPAPGVGPAGNAGTAHQVESARAARHRASVATSESFHDEVLRTTADLDTMIANAGVAGTGAAQHRVPENLPPVPDTPAEVATPEIPRH